MVKDLDIKDFAKRVERLCDFLLDKLSDESGRDGSNDVKVIEDLKEDAADIQSDRVPLVSQTFSGLDSYMRGL